MFCTHCTAINDQRAVEKELRRVSDWRELGLNLGLSPARLDKIKEEESNVDGRVGAVVSDWLKQQVIDQTTKPTWHQLADAVEPIDHALSQEIKEKHSN